jgi:hypothetical protein
MFQDPDTTIARAGMLKFRSPDDNAKQHQIKLTKDKKVATKQKFKKDLLIEPIKTDRDSEWLKKSQRNGCLPGPGLFMISGTTGSGKTVMLVNLLKKKSMLKGYWKPKNIYVFCLSPCPMLEDELGIPSKNIIHEDNPELLGNIINAQKKRMDELGFDKCERKLIICDDCAQSKTFLKSPILTTLAFAATHFRVSVWLTTQSYTQIPRRIRVNCHYLALFHGARKSELDRFLDEYESPFLTKKQMLDMVKHAIKDQYSFLFVNNTVPDKTEQFRRCFSKLLKLKKED